MKYSERDLIRYYTTKDRKRFFDVLEALRQSDIPLDNDTLELFRIFNRI